ncbi:hypothetical protein [Flavobacterium sp. FlaQc-48]|uniref:hypothetical protein n=1 Tax=Flavobacterium sp. FlaQc-48 TaxID=3374181 RepID=UPI0037570986
MEEKVKLIKFIIRLLTFSSFLLSCNDNKNGTYNIGNFDSSNLQPKLDSKIRSNWDCEGFYKNDSLIKLTFFDKSSKALIKKDSIIYRNKLRYFINVSNVSFNSLNIKLFKITFVQKKRIQRHFLIHQKGKLYLICIDEENGKSIFIRQRINTNLYKLELKSVEEYLDNINTFKKRKYYFSDFRTYEMLYKNKILIIKPSHYFSWGVGKEFSKEFPENYGSLYLDLDKNDEIVYLMDSSAY